MIDVAIAIDGEAVAVQLIRKSQGAYDANGNFVEGSPGVQTIRATMQPPSDRQLRDMEEGIRAEAIWIAWSRTPLMLDDVIAHMGDNHRVMGVRPRHDGSFYRAVLGRLK